MSHHAPIPIVFNSGMPRSGSTLVQNLLAQDYYTHCTATNELLALVCTVRDKWMQLPGFIAQGLAAVEPRVVSGLRGLVRGFYDNEILHGDVVVDKCRGHLSKIELWERVLGHPIQVIVTVRDIRAVIASFERLYRRSMLTNHPDQGENVYRRLDVRGRADLLCSPDQTVGYVLRTLQDVFDRGLQDRLVIVPYAELTHRPIETIIRVRREVGLSPHTCDPNNVEQLVREDDTVYGMKLHDVRSVVTPEPEQSWQDALPPDLADFLNSRYPFVQELAARRYLPPLETTRAATL